MSGIFTFMDSYRHFMKTYTDPRTKDWFLVGNLGHTTLIIVSYIYFCTKAGPKYMKDRKPFDLKRIVQAYNLFQIIGSTLLFYEGMSNGWINTYSFKCQPVVPGEEGYRMARATWFYFAMKIVELLDTIFFILRKKFNQVSFLHVYHHTMMLICGWIGATFLPGGHGTLMGTINCFIHIIMYTYYLLSSFGPEYQKYLWWKKHLTALQMIQFCIIFVHNVQVLFRECDYPKFLCALLASQAAYFFYLFGKFYVNQYIKNKKIILDSNGKINTENTTINKEESVANGKVKSL